MNRPTTKMEWTTWARMRLLVLYRERKFLGAFHVTVEVHLLRVERTGLAPDEYILEYAEELLT